MLLALARPLLRSDRGRRLANGLVSAMARRSVMGRVMASSALRRLPDAPCRILFLCKGNLCRSPYAAESARLRSTGETGWTFLSAGLEARCGDRTPDVARRIARERGVELEAHRARDYLSLRNEPFDVIFVMEPVQYAWLADQRIDAAAGVLLLGALSGDPLIPDPYGKSEDDYRRCFDRIDQGIACLLDAVRSGRSEAH